MGKVITKTINSFSGISEDRRVSDYSKYGITKHFDTFTYPKKLVPYRQFEAFGADSQSTIRDYKICKFVYAQYQTANNFRLYGYGVVSGTTRPKIFVYNALANDLDTTTWVATSNGEATSTVRDENVFFYYKGYIYMWGGGGNYLQRFDTTEAGAFGDTYQSVSFTSVAEPVHHPSDDVAYFFTDNKVHKLDNTSWTANALTLPTNLTITCAVPYGNYLAIGCVSNDGLGSVVYLWDRDSSLTTLTDRIDFGSGSLIHLANLNNKLIGISSYYITSTNPGLNRGKVFIRQASGSFSVSINELTTDTTTNEMISHSRVIRDNKIYFPMKLTLNSDTRWGIWAVNENGKASLELVESNVNGFKAIYSLGNMWFTCYSTSYDLSRLDEDAPGYSTTVASVYESLIINGREIGDDSAIGKTKKLLVCGVLTEPMPTAGQIVLKYRKDGETSWTTIYTDGTNSGILHLANNIESDGSNLPSFKELEFQANSTGGAVITGIIYKYEIVDNTLL